MPKPRADWFKWVAGLHYTEVAARFDPAHVHVTPQAFMSIQDLAHLIVGDGRLLLGLHGGQLTLRRIISAIG